MKCIRTCMKLKLGRILVRQDNVQQRTLRIEEARKVCAGVSERILSLYETRVSFVLHLSSTEEEEVRCLYLRLFTSKIQTGILSSFHIRVLVINY